MFEPGGPHHHSARFVNNKLLCVKNGMLNLDIVCRVNSPHLYPDLATILFDIMAYSLLIQK